MKSYAGATTVDIKKSIADIKRVLSKYKLLEGWQITEVGSITIIRFMFDSILHVINPEMPLETDRKFSHTPTGRPRGSKAKDDLFVKACKAEWRKELLYLTAKLVYSEDNPVVVKRVLLDYVQTKSGKPLWDVVLLQIDTVVDTDNMHLLNP